jgi:ATP-dependent DNA ligase
MSHAKCRRAGGYRGASAGLVYIALDLLHVDGQHLMGSRLIERKARPLALLTPAPPRISYGEHVIVAGEIFYESACRLNAEGKVSKRSGAPYIPGNRGLWRKAKCYHRKEFIIVGYTEPEGSRPYLGALPPAYHADDGRSMYAARAGTGLSVAE